MNVRLTNEIKDGRYRVSFEGVEEAEMKYGLTHVFKFKIAEDSDLRGYSLRTAVNQELSPNKFNHWVRQIACGALKGKSGTIDLTKYIGNKIMADVEIGEANFPKVIDLASTEDTSLFEEEGVGA